MFVLKSKYDELKFQVSQLKLELEVTRETRKKYASALRRFCPWFFRYECCETDQPETEYYFQLYSWKPLDGPSVYRFYMLAGNHKTVMSSEEYDSKRNALEAIERLVQRLGSSFKPVIYDSGMKRIN